MRIGMGSEHEVQIPYKDVPEEVSKLIGYYGISNADMSVKNTGDAAGLAQQIKTRVDVFSSLRDSQFVEALFNRHADQ